jgi:ABC-type nitrate/sulfonate/bicarbonate transport system substrate-binding protein
MPLTNRRLSHNRTADENILAAYEDRSHRAINIIGNRPFMISRILRSCKMGLILVVFFLSVPPPGAAQERLHFPISVASKTVGFVPVWAAWKLGYFEREGLTVDLVLMRGAEKAAMALVGESVNVAIGSADAFIAAVESSFNVAITAGIINRPSFFIMAKKNYKTFQDLRGATIGVTNISSGPAVALRYVLKAKGLEYPKDYKLQPAGPDAERTMSMTAGRLDASPLAVPFNFIAEELGLHAVGSYLEVIPDYQVSVFAVNRGWASVIAASSCSSNAA